MTRRRVRYRPRPRDDNEAYDSEYTSLVRRAVTLKYALPHEFPSDRPHMPRAKRQPSMGRSHCCREMRKVDHIPMPSLNFMQEEPESTEPSGIDSGEQWNDESVEGWMEETAVVPTSRQDVSDTGKLLEHEWDADVFTMHVPKRRRSKKKTTVVHMTDFNFQRLPSLLKGSQEKSIQCTTIRKKEEKIPKAARKPKSNAKPKRHFIESSTDERRSERRRRKRSEIDALENDKEETETVHRPSKRRGRPPLFGDGLHRGERFRRRSLRSVIEECVVGKTIPTQQKVEQDTSVLYPSLGSAKKLKSDTVKERETFIESNPRQCPTVGFLLKKGSIHVGDYVELMKQDSEVAVRGWVTHRGLLCAHCALVHSCKNFGTCAGTKISYNQLQVKDGRSFRHLLH